MQEKPLLGKVTVVTGAGSSIGLGRAMTLALVRAGAWVAMMDVNEASLEQTASDIREIWWRQIRHHGGWGCLQPGRR